MFEQVIAVDWSGNATAAGARKNIWRCRIAQGKVAELANGLTREETIAWLVEQRRASATVLVGLDFAFSYPAWFVRQHGGAARAFWQHVAEHGGTWLAQCEPPFWGRKGKHCVDTRERFRLADRSLTTTSQPKSPFQIGGAGSVGTGSLRGIPLLPQLRRAGYAVWPFDSSSSHTVVEIYPRHFTGNGNKNRHADRVAMLRRSAHLQQLDCPAAHFESASSDDNAFDALLSAAGMWKHRTAIAAQPVATGAERMEGRIFAPSCDCAPLNR